MFKILLCLFFFQKSLFSLTPSPSFSKESFRPKNSLVDQISIDKKLFEKRLFQIFFARKKLQSIYFHIQNLQSTAVDCDLIELQRLQNELHFLKQISISPKKKDSIRTASDYFNGLFPFDYKKQNSESYLKFLETRLPKWEENLKAINIDEMYWEEMSKTLPGRQIDSSLHQKKLLESTRKSFCLAAIIHEAKLRIRQIKTFQKFSEDIWNSIPFYKKKYWEAMQNPDYADISHIFLDPSIILVCLGVLPYANIEFNVPYSRLLKLLQSINPQLQIIIRENKVEGIANKQLITPLLEKDLIWTYMDDLEDKTNLTKKTPLNFRFLKKNEHYTVLSQQILKGIPLHSAYISELLMSKGFLLVKPYRYYSINNPLKSQSNINYYRDSEKNLLWYGYTIEKNLKNQKFKDENDDHFLFLSNFIDNSIDKNILKNIKTSFNRNYFIYKIKEIFTDSFQEKYCSQKNEATASIKVDQAVYPFLIKKFLKRSISPLLFTNMHIEIYEDSLTASYFNFELTPQKQMILNEIFSNLILNLNKLEKDPSNFHLVFLQFRELFFFIEDQFITANADTLAELLENLYSLIFLLERGENDSEKEKEDVLLFFNNLSSLKKICQKSSFEYIYKFLTEFFLPSKASHEGISFLNDLKKICTISFESKNCTRTIKKDSLGTFS